MKINGRKVWRASAKKHVYFSWFSRSLGGVRGFRAPVALGLSRQPAPAQKPVVVAAWGWGPPISTAILAVWGGATGGVATRAGLETGRPQFRSVLGA